MTRTGSSPWPLGARIGPWTYSRIPYIRSRRSGCSLVTIGPPSRTICFLAAIPVFPKSTVYRNRCRPVGLVRQADIRRVSGGSFWPVELPAWTVCFRAETKVSLWRQSEFSQAIPRKTARARETVTMVSASREPNTGPSLSRFTDIALSTMTCDGLRKPFCGVGDAVGLIRGASTSVPDIRRTVTVPVSLN